ncbi:MAG: hypothetical protein JNK29_00410 [Anaerolineales bacterium]|nr:hypothetical protein [Anaerolineales bacterium]
MSVSIAVRLDDRLQLAGALLAASDWPAHEQTVKAYKAHRVAEAAHKALAAHGAHPAVLAARALAGAGAGLERLYTHALTGDWPGDLGAQAADFAAAANLAGFLAEYAADFAQAEADARAVLARADLRQFLVDLAGPQPRALVFAPNLLFPGRQRVACVSAAELVVASHPPIAWGSSQPWRFSERPDEALALISEAFARSLFAQAGAANAEVWGAAGAVLFLRQAEGEAAGDQYMVMEKKARGLKTLPAAVAALEPILAARRAGQYPAGLADYLGLLGI